MKFLRMEALGGDGVIFHGFGTRGSGRENACNRQWRGQTVQWAGEEFPLVSTRQVHGNGVVIWEGGSQKLEEIWPQEGDALITRIPGYALGVFTADCLPILLFDPVKRVVGIVHAGWRGTAKGISLKAIEKMTEFFHCQGENMIAALGPAIGPCCYEVDAPVKEAFAAGELPWDLVATRHRRDKWSLDLYRANAYLLQKEGLKRENIHRLELCTSCRRDIFCSYRAEGKVLEEQLSFIALQ